jgi:hypothetical protein
MTIDQEEAMTAFWFLETKSVIKMQRRYRKERHTSTTGEDDME